jgi:phospholipid/cholesterol/gamma-HCH transport system permease protein
MRAPCGAARPSLAARRPALRAFFATCGRVAGATSAANPGDGEAEPAVIRIRGDLTVPSAGALYGQLRAVAARPGLREVVVDFTGAGRVDSSGIAVVSLAGRELERRGVRLEVKAFDDRQRGAFARLARAPVAEPLAPEAAPLPGPFERAGERVLGGIERTGERVLGAASGTRALLELIGETLRQIAAVATRRARLPAGSVARQIAVMGADGVPIIAMLSGLVGVTIAFQAILQLQRFGAGVFVADTVGLSMVRELAPLMASMILTGRTGAAIAAELGTMRVRSEIDALSAMGVSPVRYLVVPRLLAITVAGPALVLISMAIAVAGGMAVAVVMLDMAPASFWARVTERVTMDDFVHGLSKSFVFAWIIGLSGAHLGLRAGGDAGAVGAATTRTVVASISLIIIVDGIFATVSSLRGP